ncbi:signal peptidase I [Luteococcus sp. Sow4_B9]|uniref:signal peptidase I n=1 Tax=Luteococcus sp. Sow4_B9 TaxID=3438792 RepID=UPI003F9A4A6D
MTQEPRAHATQEQGAHAPDERSGGFGRRVRGAISELLVVIIGALVISAVLRAFVGQMFIIPSGSMQTTLEINDRVVVSKLSDFKRGDIVVFEDPAGWILDRPAERTGLGKVGETIGILPATGTNHLVKRVIGMPGDRVKCCDPDGRITVNGSALDETSYLYTGPDGAQVAPSDWDFEVVVPQDHIFVMGDHRDASGDSRIHLQDGVPKGSNAFIPLDKVVGPTVAIAAPFDRITRFTTPDAFDAVAGPEEPAPAEGVVVSDGYGR